MADDDFPEIPDGRGIPTVDLTTFEFAAPVQEALDERAADSFTARRVHLVALWGQSNMSGRGSEFTSFTDPDNARILQFGSKLQTLRAASEPLDHHDTPTGIGPGMQFARQYLGILSDDDVVVLVPSAHGATPLVSNATLAWRWGVVGNLAAQACDQIDAAIVAAQEAYPRAEVSLDGILWMQGETDSSTTNMVTGAAYRADLDALIAGVRARYASPDLPFVIAAMIPEALGTGTRDAINFEHAYAPYRVSGVGFAAGEVGYSNGDLLHANAAAHRRFYAPRLFAEFQRIRAGIAATNALPTFTVLSDNFNRADGPIGAPWSTFSGLAGGRVVSNQAGLDLNGSLSTVGVDPGVADGEMRITLATAGTTESVVVRHLDAQNNVFVARENGTSNLWALWKRVGNTATVVAVSDVVKASGAQLRIRMQGQQVQVYINGVLEITANVPEFTAATKCGFRADHVSVRFEDFSFSTL